jgi:DNA (cytosine-5)-methyltransferase 1
LKPRAIDLFSGCGGLTSGLRQAGFRVIAGIEKDQLAVETYRRNHRRVKVWDHDIRDVPVTFVMRHHGLRQGELDLLAGCPPCQGFSTLTTLNGSRISEDPRNDLVLEFLRFVRGLRPKAVMIENVPGIASDARMKRLIDVLESLGYQCKHRTLDAADYGVPQRRRRFILLAGRGGRIKFAHRTRRPRTVREAFGQLRGTMKRDPLSTVRERRTDNVKKLIRSIPRDGGSRRDSVTPQLDCHRRCDGFKDVYGRMAWDRAAPTITSGCCNPSKGRFLHPTRNRTVTLREAALLQTFPPTYYFSMKRGKFPTAEMIGNALPPEFIRRHALSIRGFIEQMA